MVRTVAVLVLVLLGECSIAQLTSTLSGVVKDEGSQQPLSGATVEVVLTDTVLGTTTGADGAYGFSAVPTGIHALRVRHEGHEAALVPEVWIRSGKAEVVDLTLRASVKQLGEVAVEASAPRMLSTIGAHTLTVEQSLRYPATFFDPARLATTRPGVATTNDQANHFSVRGNSPVSNAYLLEGAEIVNPNHLSNAGTASDLPVLSGGGVSILSAQMLGTSQLLTGGFGAAYGNALGGIMDMRLRNGATEGQAFTAQAGLLGIDLSTEGPFKKGGRASYLVNYRYSTLGLLSAMGVDLGDERISFQDLSVHVSLPIARGSISLFGMGGASSNIFEAKDSTEWEFDKDSQNIDYTAQMGAAGATLRLALGTKAVWTTTAVISESDQWRDADGITGPGGFYSIDGKYLYEEKLSVVSHVRGACGTRWTYQVGGSAMERTVENNFFLPERIQGWLLRPYAQAGYALSDRVRMEWGLGYAHYTFNSSTAWEPRALFQVQVSAKGTLSLAAGQRSQLPNVQLVRVRPIPGISDNTGVGPTVSNDVSVAYDHAFRSHLLFHAEVFRQTFYNVPVPDTTAALFYPAHGISMVNAWDATFPYGLARNGDATNQGIELSFQRTFHNGSFYCVNVTALNSTYLDAYGNEYDTRWNTTYMGNAIVGKEFAKQKERVKCTWGVNMRANVMGGQHYTPRATFAGEVVEPYSAQLATYYRLDLRVYLKREHQGRTGMWALDLQNATNAQNEAYRYFDTRKDEVVTKYQLGLIPNLSYRIEF